MNVNTDLGGFLRKARERVRPEQVGVAVRGTRRVPGLRREEVAALAGVSVTYYTRLEQARTAQASPSVLRAIARALALDEDDERYLLTIGGPPDVRPARALPDRPLSPHTRSLVASLANAAVAVVDHRCDVLAWNPLYHALVAPHLDPRAPDSTASRPNLIRLNFVDDRVRGLYDDWAGEALSNVSYLRLVAADHRTDERLARLVAELNRDSREFARLWASQNVASCASGVKVLRHPVAGRLELMYDAADLRDGHVMKFLHATPGTPAAVDLARLALRLQPVA